MNSLKHLISRTTQRQFSGTSTKMTSKPIVAILYQGVPPPNFGGIEKPLKPGGYSDSSADIAVALRKSGKCEVVTPVENPEVTKDMDWCYPDSPEGIQAAVAAGANTLWLNTVLHTSHPLFLPSTTSQILPSALSNLKYIHQLPSQAEKYDDKAWVNEMLKGKGLPFPEAWVVEKEKGLKGEWPVGMELPVVIKPIRGRGSHGVSVCRTQEALAEKSKLLFEEGSAILVEEFLDGEEVTVSIIPPGEYDAPVGTKTAHWTFPIVTRSQHVNDITPYNGVQAVALNSRSITQKEHDSDPIGGYEELKRNCEKLGDILGTTALIRVDARRWGKSGKEKEGKFALFDINMKPNMTGPGRPGREIQTALVGLGAQELGWDYPTLLTNLLKVGVPVTKGIEDAEKSRSSQK